MQRSIDRARNRLFKARNRLVVPLESWGADALPCTSFGEERDVILQTGGFREHRIFLEIDPFDELDGTIERMGKVQDGVVLASCERTGLHVHISDRQA